MGILWRRFAVTDLYSENVLAFCLSRGFGFYLKESDEERRENLSLGIALNLMNWDSAPTVGADGRVVEDLSGWRGFSFDIGAIVWPSENIPVAVSLGNINRPNIASQVSRVEENLPLTTRMGVAAIGEKVTLAMDMILQEGEIDLRMGMERKSYDGAVLLRTGFSLENLAWGTNFTLGAGYRPSDSVQIDYAFIYPVNTVSETLGSHRVSVIYDFSNE
jgi:hypothetical protein